MSEAKHSAERRDFSAKTHRGQAGPRFRMALLSPRWWLHWLGLGLLSLQWLLLPRGLRDQLGCFVGRQLAKGRWPRRIPVNLKRCFPELSEQQQSTIVLENCQAQACVILDLPALWLSSPKQQIARVNIDGLEHLEAEYQAGNAVCLLVCHSVGMEHAARALKWSYPLLGYYQPFGSAPVDWLFYRFRSRNGGYLLRRGDSLRQLVRDLREGWMLYMMIDEDMGEQEGHWVPFFATEKCAIKAPAKMASLSAASALPVYSWYNLNSQRYEVKILPPLAAFPSTDSEADVTQLMQSLQAMIALHVPQYNWRQQLFRSGYGKASNSSSS